jgi:DNA-binding protein YbaB
MRVFERISDDLKWTDEWLADVTGQAEQAQRLADQVAELTVTAASDDLEVEVTVTASGALTDLRLHDDIRSRPADEIASAIIDTMHRAQGRLADRVAELTTRTLGPDSDSGRALVDSYAERFPPKQDAHGHAGHPDRGHQTGGWNDHRRW